MKGYLFLQDGQWFEGEASEQWKTPAQGEIVFFTGMTGYQEVLTDPSYKDQIVVFTYPLIGNYGVNERDSESSKIQVSGVVMFHCADAASHYESTSSLGAYLTKNGVPFLTGVDTRQITKTIRTDGSKQALLTQEKTGVLQTGDKKQIFETQSEEVETLGEGSMHILLIDFGWKKSIVSSLIARGMKVTVVPFTKVDQVAKQSFDGVVLSNGPGDPKDSLSLLPELKKQIESSPTFGICMGHQVIALAFGANTKKLPFGHRGANHPVKDRQTGKVFMSSQNHSYVVDDTSLEHTPLETRFYNVNDGSVEGLTHKEKPILSVQFHPEAHPGPTDAEWLFDEFLTIVRNKKGEKVYV